MFNCSDIQGIIVTIGIIVFILHFIRSVYKDFTRGIREKELYELHQLRLLYNPNAIEKERDLKRLNDLEERYHV